MNLSAIATAVGGTAVTSANKVFDEDAKKLFASFGFRMNSPDEASIVIAKFTQLSLVHDEHEDEFYVQLWFRGVSDKNLNLGNRPISSLSQELLTSIMKSAKLVETGIAALNG